MQAQNLASLKDLVEIQSLPEKIISKASNITQFEHSQLLKQRVLDFLSDFKRKQSQSIQEHLKEPYKLRLMFKSDPKSEPQTSNTEGQSKQVKVVVSPPNIFLYAFELPCLYKPYEHMVRNEQTQKKLDDIINDYSILKQVGTNDSTTIQIVYLTYKRMMIIAPREFIYIRIFFQDENHGQNSVYWIVTFSIPYEAKSDKTRAEVIFTAQKIEENVKENKIYVKVYSEVDMKTGAKADLAKSKGFSEIKKYIQKLYDHSKTVQ